MRGIWGLPMVLLLSACSVFGVRGGTEEPRFDVVAQVGEVEIRAYPPRVAIETLVDAEENDARYQGFRRLAGYIFGANHAHTKIAMTAPVAQDGVGIAMTAPVAQDRDAAGRWRIRFFAPARYRLDTMPIPDDPRVVVVAVPAARYAVFRFTGDRSPAAVARQTDGLLRRLQGSGWRADGASFAWFYDPPWTLPFLRRNEVGVPVEPAPR